MIDGQRTKVPFHADQVFLPEHVVVTGLAAAGEARAIDVVVAARRRQTVDVRERSADSRIAADIEAVPVVIGRAFAR